MGKQNGKKVSQKQRSQKKSSSLKKYKKKGGSSQKGGLRYTYQVLVGEKDRGFITGTRERFISDIFNMIKDNKTTFETFSKIVINPYTNEQTPQQVIDNIIVPYFFNLPGTKFEGEEGAENEGAEGAENQGKKQSKKQGILSRFSSMFGNNKKGETSAETESATQAKTPEQKTSTEPDCNKYTIRTGNKVRDTEHCNREPGCKWAIDSQECMPENRVDENGKLIPFQQPLVDKCERIHQTPYDATYKKAVCNSAPGCTWDDDSQECMPENRVDENGKLIPFQQPLDKCERIHQTPYDATYKKAVCNSAPGCTWDKGNGNCIPKIIGGTLTETPTIPENTKKGLGIADNVVISAFQYAILKGNYDLVNGIFNYMQVNNGGSLLEKYVKVPVAKPNGTDNKLTRPYYLPFTQGYYTQNERLLIGSSNVTVDATTMEQFVDLFKNYAPNYTSINSQIGGGGEVLTIDDLDKAPGMKSLLTRFYKNMPSGEQIGKHNQLNEIIETNMKKVNDGKLSKVEAIENIKSNLESLLLSDSEGDESDSDSGSESDESDSEGDNEGDKQETIILKNASGLKAITDGSGPQQTRKGENVITNESGQQQNTAVEANASTKEEEELQQAGDEEEEKEDDARAEEKKSGPQQNTALKAITNASVQQQIKEEEDDARADENDKEESGPQQTSSIPVSSNPEINKLIELLKILASQGKIPNVSFDNNELRIVSASSADQDKQLGDQKVIDVDLTESGIQLNIKYRTEDNKEETIKIVLNGPPTTEEIAQKERQREYFMRHNM